MSISINGSYLLITFLHIIFGCYISSVTTCLFFFYFLKLLLEFLYSYWNYIILFFPLPFASLIKNSSNSERKWNYLNVPEADGDTVSSLTFLMHERAHISSCFLSTYINSKNKCLLIENNSSIKSLANNNSIICLKVRIVVL